MSDGRIKRQIVLWGAGKCFEDNIELIKKHFDIKLLCDKSKDKHGKFFCGIECSDVTKISPDDDVIVTIDNKNIQEEITNSIPNRTFTVGQAIEEIFFMEDEEFCKKYLKNSAIEISKEIKPIMKKYIGINYPATTCNLQCPYCYIRHTSSFHRNPKLEHSPAYIAHCLSRKRLNGAALVGICGSGETLLGDKCVEVCLELLKQGHFLHIVTNGTVTAKIHELIEKSGKMASHIFFKLSFHYMELKRRGKLLEYVQNTEYISNAGASFTVELTTDDNLIEYIDEIKEFSMKNFGALPHITIARDDTKFDQPIYTNLPLEKYYAIWSQFKSELFDVKWKYYQKKIKNCDAGKNWFHITLADGMIHKCYGGEPVGSIYDTTIDVLEFDRINDSCQHAYCYNNHALLTLGISEDIDTYTFAEVRDRVTIAGKHWVQKTVYDFIGQKLYKNSSK